MANIRKILPNLFLLCASLILFFIFAEAGFKVLHLFMSPEVSPTKIPGLPYENTPNGWFIRYRAVNGWIKYKHNSLGMRDVERTFEKPEDVKRIVCLGDSIMYGGEVASDQIFTRQLEKELNVMYPFRIEVLNCGTTSYSLKEYPVYLQNKGIKFHPDLVIVGLCLNDYTSLFRDDAPSCNASGQGGEQKKQTERSSFVKKVKRFLFHSYFLEYLKESMQTFKKKRSPASLSTYDDMRKEESWRKNAPYIDALQEICKKNDAELLFIIWPIALQFSSLKDDEGPQIYIAKILKDRSIPCVDLRAIFAERIEAGQRLYSPQDGFHFLPAGHKIAADVAVRKIMELGILNDKR